MDILIETTRISSRNNKDQRGYLFRTDEKNGKKSSRRMGWFCASGIVEIPIVCWPFISWWYNGGQVYWWTKLQKLSVFKEKESKKVVCWYYIQKKFIIHPGFFYVNKIISDPFIQNLKHNPNMVHDLSRKMKISLLK